MSRRCSARLEGAAAGSVEAARGAAPVEALAHRVALRRGHRAVEEAAGQQLDLGAGAGQRRGEGAVVGRREGRGVDELDFMRDGCGRLS